MILTGEFVHSPLNYVGGKYKLLPQLIPTFPDQIDTFIDLFCGGCNVGINVHQAKRVVFNDNLTYLIDLYKAFKETSIEAILSHIDGRINEYQLSQTNQQGYNELRRYYNQDRQPLDLFVLVAYSFNNQIRFNSDHEFNTSFGKNRSSFNEKMKGNLLKFLDRVHSMDCSFICGDFKDYPFDKLTLNDVLYCDPPYLIGTGTYNDGKRGFTGWNKNEETSLLSILSDINNRGVKFALSNVLTHKGATNSILKDWVDGNDFTVTHINGNYSNASYHLIDRDKNGTDEVIITNYDHDGRPQ